MDDVEHELDGEELLAKAKQATGIDDTQELVACVIGLQKAKGMAIIGDQNALAWAIQNANAVRETHEHMQDYQRAESIGN